MSLLDKQSLYDRHQKGALGNTIGTPANPGTTPDQGNYYAGGLENAKQESSPYIEYPGTSESNVLPDHMISLLNNAIQSKNTAQVYDPSNLDLGGGTDQHSGAIFFDGDVAPFGTYGTTLKQFGGPYTITGPSEGHY